MGKRGPGKKPTTLKVLEGNPGKKALPKNEVKPRPKFPQKTSFFNIKEDLSEEKVIDFASGFWDRNMENLYNYGLLTDIDIDTFEMLCLAYGEWRAYREKSLKQGAVLEMGDKGYKTQNPYSIRADKAQTQYEKLAAQFGLGASWRAGIEVQHPEEDDGEGLLSGVK